MKIAGVVARATLPAALLASGCAPAPPPVRTVRIAYPHEIVTLDPHAHRDLVTGTVLAAVYEGLVRFDPGTPVRPWLADRWTTPDDRTWRLHIREGILFHDGRPLTPSDVVASIERARASGALGRDLEEIEVVRELKNPEGVVEITTRKPSPLLLALLQTVAVVPRDFDPSVPVGTGPYQWRVGSLQGPVLLGRWDGYWGKAPDFEEVSIQFVPVFEELDALLHRRRVDVVASVTVSHVASHEKEHEGHQAWRVVATPPVSTTFLALNVSEGPLDDPRVRRAIDLAIDRRILVGEVFPEGTVRATQSLVPPEVFGYSAGDGRPPADPELARSLLAESGAAAGARLDLDHFNRYPPFVDFLVASLRTVGLDVEPRSLPYEPFYRRIEEAGSQLFIFSWHFRVADALPFLDTLVHSRNPLLGLGSFNGTAFSDPQVDNLIEEAAREPLTARRLERLQGALARTAEAHVYLPLFQLSNLALVREGFVLEGAAYPMARPQDVRRAP